MDLKVVRPTELQELWRSERRLWSDTLDWDVSAAMGHLERAVERGGLTGKAVRFDDRVLAYAYHAVEGERGVVSGLVVSPTCRSSPEVGELLVKAVVAELWTRRVRRIETQFIGFEAPWLQSAFEAQGFELYWREFLRLPLADSYASPRSPLGVELRPWSAWSLSETAELMHRAHRDGVDSRMNELYRTAEGCRALLHNIVRQRGCGNTIAEASAIARLSASREIAGFVVVTEIAARHGHVAQIAVAPELQGRGLGRALLGHCLSRLSELGLERLSLMVSSDNDRAGRLYRSFGFAPLHRFPVFSRDR